jgi:predicted lipoprotein with Yx(FWY)xxD motif
MTKRLLVIFSLTAAVALGLAACGSDSSGSGDSSGSSSPAAKDASTIAIADSSLGDILVDGSGRTLYLFVHDGDNTASMDCDATCKAQWPAVTGKPTAGDGVDASLIGTTTSGNQATYAGHPLYYYAGDKAAGDVNGQGVDQIWYVLSGKGTAVKKEPAEADDDSGYSGGY